MRTNSFSLTAIERRRLRALRARTLVRELYAAAGARPLWLVGGVLRDGLLGLATADVDVVAEGDGDALARRLAAALPARLVHLGGKEFAAYRLVAHRGTIDLWDREGMSAVDDLLRRDFTVNALGWEPRLDAWLDPAGGLEDLRTRRLRATRADAFATDPLRVLRLVRLAIGLPGFACEKETLTLAAAGAPAVAGVAHERIRDELSRIMRSPRAAAAAPLLGATGLYPGLWSGRLAPLRDPDARSAARRFARLLAALDRRAAFLARRHRLRLGGDELALARHALAFDALALPADALASARTRFAASGLLTRRETQAMDRLAECVEVPAHSISVRRFLHAWGRGWPIAAARVGARLVSAASLAAWRRRLASVVEIAQREGRRLFALPQLLDGHEVLRALGRPAGRWVGEVLAALEDEQLAGRIRTRRQAAAWLGQRAEQVGVGRETPPV